jgi:hypothetical protein
MPRRLVLVLLGVVAVVALAEPAIAFPGDGTGQGNGGRTGNVIEAGVTFRSGGGEGGGGSECTWELRDDQWVGDIGPGDPITVDGRRYHLWWRLCNGVGAYVVVAEATPQDLLPGILDQLRQRTLPKPVPVFKLLDQQFGWAYVRTPLDFRAGGDSWRPVSVTASVGPVWATVTARPQTLTFDPGDRAGPGPVSCGGDGPVAPYVPETPGACSYTYLNASSTSPLDGYHFQTTLTIAWSISWTSSTGAGGALAPYETSASALLAVAEIKGLVTCTGPRPEEGGC